MTSDRNNNFVLSRLGFSTVVVATSMLFMATESTFAQLLRTHRTAGNWSQTEIAHAAGITPQFVAMLESGLRNPSADTIARLSVAMDLTPRAAGALRRSATGARS